MGLERTCNVLVSDTGIGTNGTNGINGDSGAVEKAPTKPLCTITWDLRLLQIQDLESGELHASSPRGTFSTAPLSLFIIYRDEKPPSADVVLD